jgi:Na+-transporting methylmalonyl-CoA/oxaloacetate decarboxylase gamma subunit
MVVSPPFIAVETVMFFGLGFLLAVLLMLAFIPAVHQRAVRLTRKKYAPVPLEQKEMHAEKDRLRADFAMSTRKLENDIDNMQRKAAAQFVEIARRSDTIAQLKRTLDERDALVAQLQGQNGQLLGQNTQLQGQNTQLAGTGQSADGALQALRIDNITKTAALRDANARIATLVTEVERLTAAINRHVGDVNTQQQEISALSRKNGLLQQQLEAIENARAIEVRPTPPRASAPQPTPAPAFATTAPKPLAERRIANDDGDVIRRALAAIEADNVGNGDGGWMLPPSRGAVPFGH